MRIFCVLLCDDQLGIVGNAGDVGEARGNSF